MKEKIGGEAITHEMIHCPASGGGGSSLEKGSAVTTEPQMSTPAALLPHCSGCLLRIPEQAVAWEMALQPGHIYLGRSRELRHTITAGSPHVGSQAGQLISYLHLSLPEKS